MRSLRVGHDWVTSLWLFTFMHWRRKWQPTPVFLPGEYQGRGSLAVYGVAQSQTWLKRLSSSSSINTMNTFIINNYIIFSMFSTVFINVNNKFLKEIISKLIQRVLTLFLWMHELVIENKLKKDGTQSFLFPQNATTVNILSRLKFIIFMASKTFPWERLFSYKSKCQYHWKKMLFKPTNFYFLR